MAAFGNTVGRRFVSVRIGVMAEEYDDSPSVVHGTTPEQAKAHADARRRNEARQVLRELGGPQKAAIILMAVGEEKAGRLFVNMNDEEIKEISSAMATLGSIAAPIVEELFKDFVAAFSGGGSLVGTLDGAERFLSKFMDEDRLGDIMEDIRGPAGRTIWEKLSNVNEETLATYLKNEHPQTVSVVMMKLKPDHAARVLGCLPEEEAADVVQRMLNAEPVKKEVLYQVEETLRNEFMANLARTNKRDSHEMLAEIFNHFDRATEGRFMSALEERNRESAKTIKSMMFTFDDLVRVDPTGIQALLRAVDKNDLAIALKGANEEVRNLIMTNMSERAGRILQEDMEAMGPVRASDVEATQATIINLTKELADKGEVVISEEGGDDELVY